MDLLEISHMNAHAMHIIWENLLCLFNRKKKSEKN